MTAVNPIHAAAHKRVARQVKALTQMLYDSCCGNASRSGYLAGAGEIIHVKRIGSTIHITIDSFDEPPERSILKLKPVSALEDSNEHT